MRVPAAVSGEQGQRGKNWRKQERTLLPRVVLFSLFRRDNAAKIRILPSPFPRCLHRQLQLHFPCGSAVKSSCKGMRHNFCGPKSGNQNKAKRVASVPGGIARAVFRLFPSLSTAPHTCLRSPFLQPVAGGSLHITSTAEQSWVSFGTLSDRPFFAGDHKPILHLITDPSHLLIGKAAICTELIDTL
jgi:hypothetical protein